MINKFSKFAFFYLAYLPLIMILLILNMDLSQKLAYLLIGSVILCFLIFLPLFWSIKSLSPSREEIEVVSNNNSEVLGFIFTYIFPFLITFTNINSILAFSILIIMVFLIYIETSLFSVNPLLKIVFGYNIYEIKSGDKRLFLLSKKKYFGGKIKINVKQLDSEVLIEE